jgi:hypothetical protein
MDRAPDAGVGWRQKIQSDLSDLDLIWLDPTQKPIDIGLEDINSRQRRTAAKLAGDFDSVAREMKLVRHVDLRMTDVADFLVVHIDTEIYSFGTIEELVTANRMKKPIIVHVEQGKKKSPDWLFAMVPHQMIFSTWEEVYNYLKHIAYDTSIETLNRWLFFFMARRRNYCEAILNEIDSPNLWLLCTSK